VEAEEKIQRLAEFRAQIVNWRANGGDKAREWINQNRAWTRREVIEADCFHTLTISPPPAVGGLIMRNVDPFAMMFDPPFFMDLAKHVIDMIDQTIGVIRAGPIPVANGSTSANVR